MAAKTRTCSVHFKPRPMPWKSGALEKKGMTSPTSLRQISPIFPSNANMARDPLDRLLLAGELLDDEKGQRGDHQEGGHGSDHDHAVEMVTAVLRRRVARCLGLGRQRALLALFLGDA